MLSSIVTSLILNLTSSVISILSAVLDFSLMSYVLNLKFLFVVWDPNPLALNLPFLKVSWYGLTWSFSIIIGYLMTKSIFRKENKGENLTINYVQYIFFASMIGARLFDVFYYNLDQFLMRPIMVFEIWKGGLASHGAVIGVFVAMFLFSKKHKGFRFIWCVDRAALMAPLLGGFIRIGNFINGELVGKVTTVPWGVIFPYYDNAMLPRHPVQLYEAFWLFFCAGLFWFIYRNFKTKTGFFTGLFLAFVLSGRLILEFFKDSESYFGPLSNTQWMSLVAAFVGIGIILKISAKKENAVPS